MIRNLTPLANQEFDLLVIGGGINGCAIAHLAAKRGLKVILLEKGDFASGTSSKSTKLLHGGIRYLENLEFDLVRESLKERSIQLKSAPHLAKPIRFIVPVYKKDPRPLWLIRLGVGLYDFLAGNYRIGRYQSLTVEEILKLEPDLSPNGLLGGVSYYDVQMDDARICLENALSSQESGAIVINYAKINSFIKEGNQVTGVEINDQLNNQSVRIKSRKTVLTVGPWSNGLIRLAEGVSRKIIRTTKGVHIVYREKISNHALLLTNPEDRRIFFVIPWHGHSLIGTTDTNFVKTPDAVKIDPKDIAYLLSATRHAFPKLSLKEDNIITSFAGLRPLIRKGGQPSKVSRRHLLEKSPSGLITVIGGKYTTYRKIAEDCLNRITKPQSNQVFTLYGSGKVPETFSEISERYSVTIAIAQMLADFYGARFEDVLKLTVGRPELKERLCTCTPFIKAQVIYALQTELAQTAEDISERRLSLHYRFCPSRNCYKTIQEMVREYFSDTNKEI